jgi:hypothetical protein
MIKGHQIRYWNLLMSYLKFYSVQIMLTVSLVIAPWGCTRIDRQVGESLSKSSIRSERSIGAISVVGASEIHLHSGGQRFVAGNFLISNNSGAAVPLRLDKSCGCLDAELSNDIAEPFSEVSVILNLDTAVRNTGTAWVCSGQDFEDCLALTLSVSQQYIPSMYIHFFPSRLTVVQRDGDRCTTSVLIGVGWSAELRDMAAAKVKEELLRFEVDPGMEANIVPSSEVAGFGRYQQLLRHAMTSRELEYEIFGVEFIVPPVDRKARRRFLASCHLVGSDADPALISITVDPE